MKLKRLLALLLALVMVIGLVACGSKEEPKKEETKTEAPATKEETADKGEYSYITSTDKFEINLASLMNDGINEVAAAHFKEVVEGATDGNITVNLLLAGVSGGESENINQVSTGELELVLGGSNYPQQILSEWNATGIPFLFSTYDEVEEFWATYWDEMEAISLESNIRCLGLMRRGARDLTCNKEIKTPEDVKGLVLRLPDNATWKVVWESLGATCTPVNMQEVYTALQTGVVNAQENPIGTTYENNLQEVCDYNVLTHHIVQHFPWMINEDFWQSLPEDYQRLIKETIDYECEWAIKQSEVNDAEYRKKAEADGMKFLEVDANAFRQAAMDGILAAASTMNEETQNYIKGMLEG